jgi:hypothetical protein
LGNSSGTALKLNEKVESLVDTSMVNGPVADGYTKIVSASILHVPLLHQMVLTDFELPFTNNRFSSPRWRNLESFFQELTSLRSGREKEEVIKSKRDNLI